MSSKSKSLMVKLSLVTLCLTGTTWAQTEPSNNEQGIATLLLTKETIVAALISAIVSLITFFIANKIKLQKINSKFSGQLHSKRLEAYPEIYELVCEFFKKIKRTKISYKELNDFYEKYSILDSKLSILFNIHTVKSSVDLMNRIKEIVDSKKASDDVLNDNLNKELIENLIDVEITLKVELGAFEFKEPSVKESCDLKLLEEKLKSSLKSVH
jgi:hypothetical protein